ncbi:hypothetical protein ACHAPU_011038, partial [Fusarium lateritium]
LREKLRADEDAVTQLEQGLAGVGTNKTSNKKNRKWLAQRPNRDDLGISWLAESILDIEGTMYATEARIELMPDRLLPVREASRGKRNQVAWLEEKIKASKIHRDDLRSEVSRTRVNLDLVKKLFEGLE